MDYYYVKSILIYMDYKRIYNQLCERGQTRERDDNEYYEKHHIIPRCKGGTNDSDNLTYLTAREHFLCHWLLHRIEPTDGQYASAFHLMAMSDKYGHRYGHKWTPSSRSYAEAKEAKSMALTLRHETTNLREKINEGIKQYWIDVKSGKRTRSMLHYERDVSDDTKEKMSKAKLGWNRSDEDKRKISEGKKRAYRHGKIKRNYDRSDETKERMSKLAKLRQTDEWDEVKDRVYDRYMSGDSITHISQDEPVSRQSIYRWINENDWTR